jgi:hypothetical protein
MNAIFTPCKDRIFSWLNSEADFPEFNASFTNNGNLHFKQ